MIRKPLYGDKQSTPRVVLIIICMLAFAIYIVIHEAYSMIIPFVLGGLAFAKYLYDTFKKDTDE